LEMLRNDRSCDWVSTRVLTARRVGEGAAILVGAAMGATAAPVSDPGEVANRIQRLQLLLYCGSLLFVAGILMSESNFSLIIAQLVGDAGDDKMSKGLADVIKSGTVQAGVGYSAVLAAFFLPPRAYLAMRARTLGRRALSAASSGPQLADRAADRKS